MFTTDTRKAHCPINILYTEVMTGDTLHANELDARPWRLSAGRTVRPLAIIRDTEFSDYSGDVTQRSNHRVLAAANAECRGELICIIGSHGYQALAYDATLGPVPSCVELWELLESLESGHVVDVDDVSTLEMELEGAAWEEDGRKDFRKHLTALFNGSLDEEFQHDLDDVEDDDIDELWHAGCDAFNVNGGSGHKIETGNLVYFYVEEWLDKSGKAMSGRASELAAQLRNMAHATRIQEG